MLKIPFTLQSELCMNIQKNFAVVCAALAALPTAFAETASVERDAAALATTSDYVNSGSVIRKDEDKIRDRKSVV